MPGAIGDGALDAVGRADGAFGGALPCGNGGAASVAAAGAADVGGTGAGAAGAGVACAGAAVAVGWSMRYWIERGDSRLVRRCALIRSWVAR